MFNNRKKHPAKKGDPRSEPSEPVTPPEDDPALGSDPIGDMINTVAVMQPPAFEDQVRYFALNGESEINDEALLRAMVSAAVEWWLMWEQADEVARPEFAQRSIGQPVVPMNDAAVDLISAMVRAELPEDAGFPEKAQVKDVGPSAAYLATALLHADRIREMGWEAYNAEAIKRFERHTEQQINTMGVLIEIGRERAAQDEQWGGADHDDRHSHQDWASFRERFAVRAWNASTATERRENLIKLAALAVAEIEAMDRRRAKVLPRGEAELR